MKQQCGSNGTARFWQRKDGWNLFAVFKDEIDHFRYSPFAIRYSFNGGRQDGLVCWQRVGRWRPTRDNSARDLGAN